MQRGIRCGPFDHAEIQLTVGDLPFDLFGIPVKKRNANIGIELAEFRQQAGQHVLRQRRTRPEADFTRKGPLLLDKSITQLSVQRQNAVRIFEQPDAVVGQGDPVAVTQEERFPQQPFQLVDLLGDGRLRNEQFGRSFRKTEPVGDGLKDFQAEIGQHSFPRLKNRIGCCLRTGLLHPLAVQRRRRTIGHPHPDVIAHPGIAPVENHHFVL